MPATLNDTQLELLKLMNFVKSEKDLAEIKSLLIAYLADKVVEDADRGFDQKNYTQRIFEDWKKEHYRKSA